MEPTSPQTPQPAEDSAEIAAIKAAKAAAGISYPLLVLPTDDGTRTGKEVLVAFRRPSSAEWHRYRSESLDRNPEVQANALQCIVVPCAIYPARQAFVNMINERPGLVEQFGSELVEYAGADRSKKVTLL
jgi:hypothetical protein